MGDPVSRTADLSGWEPEEDNKPGPWFIAGYDSDDASCCAETISEGDTIRADGYGGYEHEDCVVDDAGGETFM